MHIRTAGRGSRDEDFVLVCSAASCTVSSGCDDAGDDGSSEARDTPKAAGLPAVGASADHEQAPRGGEDHEQDTCGKRADPRHARTRLYSRVDLKGTVQMEM